MIHEGKGKSGETAERPKEIDGEQKLTKKPIRIKPQTPRDQLDPRSRLNYAKIYTVEYNVKVCFIGSVHENSEKYFRRDFNLVHTPLPEDPDTKYSDEEWGSSVSRPSQPRDPRDPDHGPLRGPRKEPPRGKGSGRS
jgi:hypothetical protein